MMTTERPETCTCELLSNAYCYYCCGTSHTKRADRRYGVGARWGGEAAVEGVGSFLPG